VREPCAIAVVGADVEELDGRPVAAARLASLRSSLDAAFPGGLLAPFELGSGRIVGLLAPGIDPLRPVLVGSVGDGAVRLRWGIAQGALASGRGGIARRARALTAGADDAIDLGRARRDHLVVRTGVEGADRLLDGIAPLLVELLDDLTDRQRTVARLILLDGLRQSDVADALGVSRATVSVMVGRGRIRSVERLAGAIRAVMSAAADASAAVMAGEAGNDVEDEGE
jgi:DNA-binding CsgD family transcriptional regulator